MSNNVISKHVSQHAKLPCIKHVQYNNHFCIGNLSISFIYRMKRLMFVLENLSSHSSFCPSF